MRRANWKPEEQILWRSEFGRAWIHYGIVACVLGILLVTLVGISGGITGVN